MKLPIDNPTLLLDERKCRANIRRMAEKAKRNGIQFRPHFKTHQSLEIGRWFRDIGVDRITVSSLLMAEYFAQDGWEDITVAFPVNIRETDRINSLAKTTRLNVLLESVETVEALQKALKHTHDVFIKVDIGNHRTGLHPEDEDLIGAVLHAIGQTPQLRFKGFLGHAGNSYSARGKDAVQKVHDDSMVLMRKLKMKYGSEYPDLIISTGDTPGCSLVEDLDGTDEIRPGNFVFYDLMQWQIGACDPDDIAVAVACPVVAKHPERQEIVLYGGAVHLSKDRIRLDDGNSCYGFATELTEDGWGNPIPDTFLKALSQEHGILKANGKFFEKTRVGDLIGILPVHSCLTADLLGGYLELKGKRIGAMTSKSFK